MSFLMLAAARVAQPSILTPATRLRAEKKNPPQHGQGGLPTATSFCSHRVGAMPQALHPQFLMFREGFPRMEVPVHFFKRGLLARSQLLTHDQSRDQCLVRELFASRHAAIYTSEIAELAGVIAK